MDWNVMIQLILGHELKGRYAKKDKRYESKDTDPPTLMEGQNKFGKSNLGITIYVRLSTDRVSPYRLSIQYV